MDNLNSDSNRPVNPRRKKRTQMQIFKEAYLPTIIAGVAVLLIIIFIIGSISRAVQKNKAEQAANIAASEALAAERARLEEEALHLVEEAQILAVQHDYEGAIAILNAFEDNIQEYSTIADKLAAYQKAQEELVAWDDISQIPNLSFQLLVADPARAYADEDYGSSYNKNFVTTTEFSAILQQLYDNGYVLVTPNDFVATQEASDGSITYTTKPIYLPSGKKPITLTQTQVNYYTYMVDGDGDKRPDKDGAGFASRLLLDDNGEFTCEMVTATGETVTGAYDLVPILENFLKSHPDFSYQGSRAVLALTGYDGLFGYRTTPTAKARWGQEEYDTSVAAVKELIQALRTSGYELACYTYSNTWYGDDSVSEIKDDLTKWNQQVAPILGEVSILAFSRDSDISKANTTYSGAKFDLLQSSGFRIYLGFCNDGISWATVNSQYVRMGRILVTGSNMAYHADWFTGLFDARSVLDPSRGQVPR